MAFESGTLNQNFWFDTVKNNKTLFYTKIRHL